MSFRRALKIARSFILPDVEVTGTLRTLWANGVSNWDHDCCTIVSLASHGVRIGVQ